MTSRPAGPDPDHDTQALRALVTGDRREALTILMHAYGQAIYRYCTSVLRDRTMADDVHQTVFEQAFRNLDDFSGEASFRPWLYAIAHHRCADALKLRRRWRDRFSPCEEPPDNPDPTPSGEERLVRRALTSALGECLGALPPQVRMAVALRYQGGFTYEAMALICGELPTTLQARVARALPILKKCLDAKGIRP